MLSDEEMVRATAWERIATIDHFILGRVSQWAKTLHPRERANCDVDDATQAVKLKLARKNDKWEPSKGKYITFAETIIRHELEHLREKSRTVESPKNCAMRLRQYEAMASGVASQSKLETAEKMRRTIGGMDVAAEADGVDGEHPFELLGTREEILAMAAKAVASVCRLPSSRHIAIVSRRYGLWNHDEQDIGEIARSYGMQTKAVSDKLSEGLLILRGMLEELNAGRGNQAI